MKCYIVHNKPYDEEEVYKVLKKYGISTTSLATKADFVLAIGGDGAVIKAFHEVGVGNKNIQILGYNTGTLGFLSSGEDLDGLIYDLTEGILVQDKRQVIQCDYESFHGNYHGLDFVLNEVAIMGQETGKLVELDLSINKPENIVTTYKGDGLIVATPTGSTAYNLSVGGPIMEPWCKSLIISPISPFSMSSRPLVVCDNTVIYVDKCQKVIIDGRLVRLPQGTRIEICLTEVFVTLLKRRGETFYDSISSKLGWGYNIKN